MNCQLKIMKAECKLLENCHLKTFIALVNLDPDFNNTKQNNKKVEVKPLIEAAVFLPPKSPLVSSPKNYCNRPRNKHLRNINLCYSAERVKSY